MSTATDQSLEVDPLDVLAARIREKEATVAVVGLGYVGLPLLVGIARAGFPVIGVDASPDKIDVLNEGRSYIVDLTDSEIASIVEPVFSANPGPLSDADVIVLCL